MNNEEKLQAELTALETELGRIINTAVLISGLPMVKTCLLLLRQAAINASPLDQRLYWAAGVLEGAPHFVDKPQG